MLCKTLIEPYFGYGNTGARFKFGGGGGRVGGCATLPTTP